MILVLPGVAGEDLFAVRGLTRQYAFFLAMNHNGHLLYFEIANSCYLLLDWGYIVSVTTKGVVF